MQQIIIAGNIGKDAEVRRLQSGDPVANFSVAVDNGKDSSGQRRESTWYDCALWGKRGESLAPYLLKGGKVTVTGRPTVRVHDGKAYLGVNVDQITLQGGKQDSQGGYGHSDPARQAPAGGAPAGGYEDPLGGDSIPFAPIWWA